MIGAVLASNDPTELLQNEEFLWLVGALVVTLLSGALLISWIERWRKRQLTDTPAAEVERFGSYRAMYEKGELTKEEYDRIRQKEAHRVRDKLAPKTAKPTPIAKEPPTQSSPPEAGSPPPPS